MAPDHGLTSSDLHGVMERVAAAWDEFVDLADDAPYDAPTRLPGWTVREVLLHLGAWDDRHPLVAAVASARDGGAGTATHPDEDNRRLVETHRDASREDVLAALRRSRDRVAHLIETELEAQALATTASSLGPLPLGTLVNAGCYELAVHALDIAAAGGDGASDQLLDAGVAALVDVTGGLCARHRIDVALTARTDVGGWRFAAALDGHWRTDEHPVDQISGAGVRATARDLLDASAGRANVPRLLMSRRLVVQQMTTVMRLAPLIEHVPGLPGGAALGRAVGFVAGSLGRLPGLGR